MLHQLNHPPNQWQLGNRSLPQVRRQVQRQSQGQRWAEYRISSVLYSHCLDRSYRNADGISGSPGYGGGACLK